MQTYIIPYKHVIQLQPEQTTVNGISETEIVQSNAEVRFLRAYYYFLLVEQFGDVPLVEDEITSAITHFDRIPEADIYKYIINELSVVVSKLPIKAAEFGRATQGACKNLLSLVYLTRGYKAMLIPMISLKLHHQRTK